MVARAPSGARMHAFSIDLEDWFHPELVRHHLTGAEHRPRLRQALEPLLGLLRARGVRATFFILGPIVDQNRDLVAQLHSEGHEIACHGMTHKPLWEISRDELRRELVEWRDILRSVDPAIPARGYRAPTFSLDARTSWAREVLAEEGFEYDSSIFPFKNHVYGVTGAPLTPYWPDPGDLTRGDAKGPIREFPMTVLGVGRLRVPVSGGFYLRALPFCFLRWAPRRIGKQRPFVLYCHPWEFDAETPRVPLGLADRLITYTGMRSGLRKVERLLDEFAFGRMDEVLASHA